MSTHDRSHLLETLARAFEYPDSETASIARQGAGPLAGNHIALASAMWDLAVWLENTPRGEIEERYTGLFDLNPICTLNLGYHVFGDTYPRGELIAGLARELRLRGLNPGQELPDYLPTLLRLLARIQSPEDARLLLSGALLPGLNKAAEALRDSHDAWSDMIRALPPVLEDLMPGEATHPMAHSQEDPAHA